MGKICIKQHNSVNAPAVAAEKTSPMLRVYAGHSMVLTVKFYLRDALVTWLKFKKGHTYFLSHAKRDK